MKHFKSLLKNKNFVYLWISQFFSQIAIHIMNFLVVLIVFKNTGSTIATSFVWLTFIIPAIIVGPFAYVYADFVNRKKILIISNFFQALILLCMAATYKNVFYLTYALLLIYSIFNQFYVPSEISVLPSVVKKSDLPQANGLFLSTYQIGLVLGFIISGLVGEVFGFGYAFLIASFLVFGALISVIFLPGNLFKTDKRLKILNIRVFVREILAGYKFIAGDRKIFFPFVTIASLQVALAIVFVNLPAISQDLLEINPNYSGLAVVFPAVAGAIFGIVFVSKLLSERWSRKRTVKVFLGVMTAMLWSSIIITSFLPGPYRIGATFLNSFLIGISFIAIYISAQTQLQVSTPNNFMGRVFGNSWFLTTAATVIPLMFSATITDTLGVRALFAFVGGILFVATIFYEKILSIKIEI